eukprot:14303340-Heterocapsa_arctica.AAC.1
MWDRDPELELDYEDDVDVGKDAEPLEGHARSASPEPLATAPSALEHVKHCLTHLPFQRWCPHCIKARAQDQAHYSQESDERQKAELELVQFDYSFMKRQAEETPTPVLIGSTRRSGYAFGSV